MSTTLKFYTDAALTSPLSSALQVIQEVLAAAVDKVLYLGSATAARQFQADSNPGVDQLTLTITNATALWQASTAYVLTDMVRTTAKNGYKYEATVAGNSGATEPTWPTTIGNTVVDGTVTWTCTAKIHESTELKLALSAAGLDTAVAGDPLNLGTQILSEAANAVAVYIRADDATDTVGTETELSLVTNTVRESTYP